MCGQVLFLRGTQAAGRERGINAWHDRTSLLDQIGQLLAFFSFRVLQALFLLSTNLVIVSKRPGTWYEVPGICYTRTMLRLPH